METEFPKPQNQFLKASMFQDQEIPLTYRGWARKANEDIEASNGRAAIPWKQRVKYQLRYSYPEWAMDEAGEKQLDKNGQPFRNKNYDPKYPQGYSIRYVFDEGSLESGSLPLFNAFCMVRPQPGDVILVSRTGEKQETKWKIQKVHGDLKQAQSSGVIDFDEAELAPDEEVPF